MTIRSNNRRNIAAARATLRAAGVHGLLADPLSNPKVAKNGKLDVLTAPLHLAPFDLSGFQVCPQASAGCAAACLHTAGNPAYMAQKSKSRIAKTRAYFQHRDAFLTVLIAEIERHVERAHKAGKVAAIRLNATSDIPWERVAIKRNMVDGEGTDVIAPNVMSLFPEVEFYDYTKVTKRAIAQAQGRFPANYRLTFSATENNAEEVSAVLSTGGNVAMVFNRKAKDVGTYMGYEVIDGDAHDYRPADKQGVIVGLKAKGDARQDTSGFVRQV